MKLSKAIPEDIFDDPNVLFTKRLGLDDPVPVLPDVIDGVRYFNKAWQRDEFASRGPRMVPVFNKAKERAVDAPVFKPSSGGSVKPMNWTKEERRRLKEWRRDSIGGGADLSMASGRIAGMISKNKRKAHQ